MKQEKKSPRFSSGGLYELNLRLPYVGAVLHTWTDKVPVQSWQVGGRGERDPFKLIPIPQERIRVID